MKHLKIPLAADRVGVMLSVADHMNPGQLSAAIDALIDRLDAAAGDPDLEANGDELDGSGAEDDFMRHGCDYGPGCHVADADCCEASDDDFDEIRGDGSPGDADDAEDGGDTELNGDELDGGFDANA